MLHAQGRIRQARDPLSHTCPALARRRTLQGVQLAAGLTLNTLALCADACNQTTMSCDNGAQRARRSARAVSKKPVDACRPHSHAGRAHRRQGAVPYPYQAKALPVPRGARRTDSGYAHTTSKYQSRLAAQQRARAASASEQGTVGPVNGAETLPSIPHTVLSCLPWSPNYRLPQGARQHPKALLSAQGLGFKSYTLCPARGCCTCQPLRKTGCPL